MAEIYPVRSPADLERLAAAAASGESLAIVSAGLIGTPRELDALGKALAFIASAARGPVTIRLTPDLPTEFVASLRQWVAPTVRIDGDEPAA